MPIKLFPQLRLLNNPSLPVSFKCGAALLYSRSVPVFTRIFPFKLKYLGLVASRGDVSEQPGVRRLSTRSFKPRPGSSSEFTRRDSKSLIDDEAELSDWVSESVRGRFVASEGESDSDMARNRNGTGNRGRGGGGGRGRGGGRFGGREESSFSMKRRRESDSGEFGESNRRRTDSFSRGTTRFGDDDDNKKFDSQRNNRGRGGFRGGGFRGGVANSFVGKRDLDSRGKMNEFSKKVDMSDDDDDDEEKIGLIRSGIGNLLSEEESESSDFDDDDDDDSVLRKNASSSLGLNNKEVSVKTSSPGKYDSYLSESRYVKNKKKIASLTFN